MKNAKHFFLSGLLLAGLVGVAPKKAKAALPATTTTWEVQPTNGVDTNAGCFIAGATGTDLTYPTSGPVSFSDYIIGGTTTQLTSVAFPFAASDVGNCVKVASGAGCTTGIYYVVSVATVTATMDRSVGTAASTCTGVKGGALKTLTQLNTNMGGSNIAYVKAEAVITTATQFTINFTGVNGVPSQINGYTSTRSDNGQVTLRATAAMGQIVDHSSNSLVLRNFILDANAVAAVGGLRFLAQWGVAENIKATVTGGRGFGWSQQTNVCVRCVADGGTIEGFNFGNNAYVYCYFCVSINHVGTAAHGFVGSGSFYCLGCVAANNTGTTSDGFSMIAGGSIITGVSNSVACGNGRDGIRWGSANLGAVTTLVIMNNVLTGNGVSAAGYGVNFSGMTQIPGTLLLDYNAYYNNATAARNGNTAGVHDVTLTASPYNCAGTDFTLNATAGGGAALRAVGFPGVLPTGGTGYLDIGALQSAPVPASVTVGYPIQ